MEGGMGESQQLRDAERDVAAMRAAFAKLEPPSLRERTIAHLVDQPMGAGRLVRHSAGTADGRAPQNALQDRVVGVQLIHVGLGLIRELARDPPWEQGDGDEGNLDALVAEVLVAKGFSLLASTPAASKAVETVQSLARSETARLNGTVTGSPLEADIFELGVQAGVSAIEAVSPEDLDGVAHRVARRLDETDDQEAIVFANRWRNTRITAQD